jgi:hypothetical protein
MALVSHLPVLRNPDAWFARICGFARVLAPLPLCLTLLAPATVRGDNIYKWTDERGNTVISNIQPAASSRVSDVELLAATRPAAQMPAAPPPKAATRTEQALEARIQNLERQLETQQYEQQPQADPQSSYPADYYAAPAAPPPDPGYYSGYGAGYDPGYYPGYYPGFYNPWPPAYSFIVAPARTFAHRPGNVHRPGVGVGRRCRWLGRRCSASASASGRRRSWLGLGVHGSALGVRQSAGGGVSRSASFGGGSMHGGRR